MPNLFAALHGLMRFDYFAQLEAMRNRKYRLDLVQPARDVRMRLRLGGAGHGVNKHLPHHGVMPRHAPCSNDT